MSYDTILTQQRDRVLLITLNRPEALNALNTQLSHELIDALTKADRDDGVGCIVITGSAKAFAAGADFKEMQTQSYTDMRGADFFGQWDALATLRKPTIAAVSGYALGGGCELAMMCDFILCSDTAQFGQPEIKLGVMPGMGRQPEADPAGRSGQGDGDVFHRSHDGRRRGRTRRTGQPGDPRRRPAGRGDDDRCNHRIDVACPR